MKKIAAISDLHLGAPTSYLAIQAVRERLFKTLANLCEGHLDLLVLVGDVIDLTVGHTTEPWICAQEFFAELARQPVSIDNIVYVPGNHDHHVWVLLVEHMELLSKLDRLENPDTARPLSNSSVSKIYAYPTPFHKLFSQALQTKVRFAYPFYSFESTDMRFVFHHGHYFDPAITPLANYAAEKYQDLAKIEAFNLPYLEALFHSCTWDPLVQNLELTTYSKLVELANSRVVGLIKQILPQHLFGKTTESVLDLGRCDTARIDQMMQVAGFKTYKKAPKDIWVFGHTHSRDQACSAIAPTALRMFNVGGWILNHDPAIDEKCAWSTPSIFFCDRTPTLEYIDLLPEEKEMMRVRLAPLTLAKLR